MYLRVPDSVGGVPEGARQCGVYLRVPGSVGVYLRVPGSVGCT